MRIQLDKVLRYDSGNINGNITIDGEYSGFFECNNIGEMKVFLANQTSRKLFTEAIGDIKGEDYILKLLGEI